jgi:hypothetical protein
MTATIEIQTGQVWDFGGKLFHVDSVDEDGEYAAVGRAYRTTGGIFNGRITLIEATLKWTEADFIGGKLVHLG